MTKTIEVKEKMTDYGILESIDVDNNVEVIRAQIEEECCKDIIINGKLLIHVRVNSDNISVDYSKAQMDVDDGSDYIDGTYFTDEDLEPTEEEDDQ